MKPSIVPVLALMIVTPLGYCAGASTYISLSSIYHSQTHTLLGQTANNDTLATQLEWNSQKERLKHSGWLARGVQMSFASSSQYASISANLPIYHVSPQNGFWLSVYNRVERFTATLETSRIYLDKEGNASSVTSGSALTADLISQGYEVYWKEDTLLPTLINEIGFVYQSQTTPIQVNLNSTNATLFDGQMTGWGIRLGKHLQPRGLSLDWDLAVLQLDTDFSNSVTEHRAVAPDESKCLWARFQLRGQYRHYITPYWYAAPFVGLDLQGYIQQTRDPNIVEQPTSTVTKWQAGLQLQKWF